jgi:hypothetical protein
MLVCNSTGWVSYAHMQAPVCRLQVPYLAQPWLTLNQALVWCCGMWPKRQSPLTAAPCTAAAQSTLVLLCVAFRNCTVHSCCCKTEYGLSKPPHKMHMVCNGHNAHYLAQLLLAAVCIGVPKLLLQHSDCLPEALPPSRFLCWHRPQLQVPFLKRLSCPLLLRKWTRQWLVSKVIPAAVQRA